MKPLLQLASLLFLSLLSACSSSKPQTMHFENKAIPIQPKESWGIGVLSDELIIGSRPQFQKDLNLSSTELEDVIKESLNDSLAIYLTQANKATVHQIPSLQRGSLAAAQSLRMDSTSFIKVYHPLQGQVFSSEKNTPRYLFLIHDLYLGMGLKAEDLYNYQKAHIEQASTPSKIFSVVLSYSLWDNHLQQFIRYGAIDWRKASFQGIHPKLIHQGVKNAIAKAWEARP